MENLPVVGEQNNPSGSINPFQMLNWLVGIVLIGIGCALSYWLFRAIGDFLYAPEKIALLGKILQTPSGDQSIRIILNGSPNGTGQGVTVQYNDFVKYFVFLVVGFILFGSIGRIISAFFSAGIKALTGRLQ